MCGDHIQRSYPLPSLQFTLIFFFFSVFNLLSRHQQINKSSVIIQQQHVAIKSPDKKPGVEFCPVTGRCILHYSQAALRQTPFKGHSFGRPHRLSKVASTEEIKLRYRTRHMKPELELFLMRTRQYKGFFNHQLINSLISDRLCSL